MILNCTPIHETQGKLYERLQNMAPARVSLSNNCSFEKMRPIFGFIYYFCFQDKNTRASPEERNEQKAEQHLIFLPGLFWNHIWQSSPSLWRAPKNAWQKHFQVWSIFVFLRHLCSLSFYDKLLTNFCKFQIKTLAHKNKFGFELITEGSLMNVLVKLNCL